MEVLHSQKQNRFWLHRQYTDVLYPICCKAVSSMKPLQHQTQSQLKEKVKRHLKWTTQRISQKLPPNELYHQMTVRRFMPSLAPGMELGKLRKGSWSSNENPRWLHSAASSYLETWHAPSWGLWALPNVSNWKLTTATKKTASLREKITQISSTHAGTPVHTLRPFSVATSWPSNGRCSCYLLTDWEAEMQDKLGDSFEVS